MTVGVGRVGRDVKKLSCWTTVERAHHQMMTLELVEMTIHEIEKGIAIGEELRPEMAALLRIGYRGDRRGRTSTCRDSIEAGSPIRGEHDNLVAIPCPPTPVARIGEDARGSTIDFDRP
jgi:hypothetical protein